MIYFLLTALAFLLLYLIMIVCFLGGFYYSKQNPHLEDWKDVLINQWREL